MTENEGYSEDVAAGLGEDIPDESEQLDQIQPDDSLVDRGVDDVLDEGLTTPQRWSVEERDDDPDTLDERVSEEVPDFDEVAEDSEAGVSEPGEPETVAGSAAEYDTDDDQVGGQRAGRLVEEDEGIDTDTDPDMVGFDVGIDAGAAGAEEASVHVVPDPGDEVADWSETEPRDEPS
jgi:hypothetical protein